MLTNKSGEVKISYVKVPLYKSASDKTIVERPHGIAQLLVSRF